MPVRTRVYTAAELLFATFATLRAPYTHLYMFCTRLARITSNKFRSRGICDSATTTTTTTATTTEKHTFERGVLLAATAQCVRAPPLQRILETMRYYTYHYNTTGEDIRVNSLHQTHTAAAVQHLLRA